MAQVERDPERAAAALLTRRALMRPDPGRIEQLVGMDRESAVSSLLDAPSDDAQAPEAEKSDATLTWWLNRIGENVNGLQERMAFLWHSIIPTNRHAVGNHGFVGMQLNMIRPRALGNFRDLLQSFAIDPAMLKYLDAESSTAKNPNENLAREIMELFSLGVGHYSEDDVRQAALAMTGWRVDGDGRRAYREPNRTYEGETTFLGETKMWDVTSIVDRLCDHPATAERIASLVWYHFVGTYPTGEAKAELGTWWQAQNLEIKPLLQRIFLDEQFWASHYVRPRSGFEYYTAVQNILGLDPSQHWRPRELGQMVFEPPNVGGWPEGSRWLTPDSMLRRASMMFSVDFKDVANGLTATTEEILDACGLYVINDQVIAAMAATVDHVDEIGQEGPPQLKWRIAMSCPEFQLQ